MGYHTWHDYGYGVQMPYQHTDRDRIYAFAQKHGLDDLVTYLDEDAENETDWHYTVGEYEDGYNCHCGIAAMLCKVIRQEKDVYLYSCSDDDDKEYLLFTPCYPWNNLTDAERAIKTEDDVETLLLPYLEEIYGKDHIPGFDYQECANGC